MAENEKILNESSNVNYYEIINQLKKFLRIVENSKSLDNLDLIISEILAYIFNYEETKNYYIEKVNEHMQYINQAEELKLLLEEAIKNALTNGKLSMSHSVSCQDIFFYEFGNGIEKINEENFINYFRKGIFGMYKSILEQDFTHEFKIENNIPCYVCLYPEFIYSIDFFVLPQICGNFYGYFPFDTKSARLYLKSALVAVIYQLINLLEFKANNMFYGEFANVHLTLCNIKNSDKDLFETVKTIKENENSNRTAIAKKLNISPATLDKKCQKFCNLVNTNPKGLGTVIKILNNINFSNI